MLRPTVVQVIGVDGRTYTLTDESFSGPSILLQKGAKGLDAPPFVTHADEYPAIDGGFVRFSRASIREIYLPIKIVGATRDQMMRLKRRFIASLNPKRGMVSLQVTEYTRSGGVWVAELPRAISCYYVSGLEGGEGQDGNYHWATYGVVLRAPDPYFHHLTRSIGTFLSYDIIRSFFGAPFLSPDGQAAGAGLALSTDPVWTDEVMVHNAGDVESQPRWEIRGPVRDRMSMQLLAEEDGAVLAEMRFREPITVRPDQVLVIETKHGRQSVRLYDEPKEIGSDYDPTEGRSMWWAFDVGSQMWALQPGWNRIRLAIEKPAGLTSEEEEQWRAANMPDAAVSILPRFMGV